MNASDSPVPLAEDRRRELMQELGTLMSQLSEACFCAGWLGGTELFVPALCQQALVTKSVRYWGVGEVTPELAAKMVDIAERLGHWVDMDVLAVGYEPFDPGVPSAHILEELNRQHQLSSRKRAWRSTSTIRARARRRTR